MAQQGVFTLPPRINFGVTALTNAAYQQNITVYVDNEPRATFSEQLETATRPPKRLVTL